MTIDRVLLSKLLEKGSDTDLLREMMQATLNAMMDLDVEARTSAAYGERTGERTNSRNGYRARPLDTTVGTLDLAIPKLRKGTYFPPFLEARRTADKALIATIQEAYVHGVSTRAVDDLVKAMGCTGMDKSQVSRLCKEIDERVNTLLDRPIEGTWPYLWIDATYVKVREGGRIRSVAVIIAVAVNTDGRREVLKMALCVLGYNLTRVMNIVGVKKLMEAITAEGRYARTRPWAPSGSHEVDPSSLPTRRCRQAQSEKIAPNDALQLFCMDRTGTWVSQNRFYTAWTPSGLFKVCSPIGSSTSTSGRDMSFREAAGEGVTYVLQRGISP